MAAEWQQKNYYPKVEGPCSAREAYRHLGGWKTEWMMRRYAAVTDRTLRAVAVAAARGNEPDRSPVRV